MLRSALRWLESLNVSPGPHWECWYATIPILSFTENVGFLATTEEGFIQREPFIVLPFQNSRASRQDATCSRITSTIRTTGIRPAPYRTV